LRPKIYCHGNVPQHLWTPIQHMIPTAHLTPQPKQHPYRFSRLCTDDHRVSLCRPTRAQRWVGNCPTSQSNDCGAPSSPDWGSRDLVRCPWQGFPGLAGMGWSSRSRTGILSADVHPCAITEYLCHLFQCRILTITQQSSLIIENLALLSHGVIWGFFAHPEKHQQQNRKKIK